MHLFMIKQIMGLLFTKPIIASYFATHPHQTTPVAE
jgi:hypothetical protein